MRLRILREKTKVFWGSACLSSEADIARVAVNAYLIYIGFLEWSL